MSRFAAIKSDRAARMPALADQQAMEPPPPAPAQPRTPSRSGKKAISGYFSPGMSKALHLLAVENDTNLQALMGEAFDDLMRKYGKHPFGER